MSLGDKGKGMGEGEWKLVTVLSYLIRVHLYLFEKNYLDLQKVNENILLCIFFVTPLKLDLAMIDTQFLLFKSNRFIDNQKYELRKNT